MLGAIVAFVEALSHLRGHDYVSAVLAILLGLAVLGAGVELLRPTVGE